MESFLSSGFVQSQKEKAVGKLLKMPHRKIAYDLRDCNYPSVVWNKHLGEYVYPKDDLPENWLIFFLKYLVEHI